MTSKNTGQFLCRMALSLLALSLSLWEFSCLQDCKTFHLALQLHLFDGEWLWLFEFSCFFMNLDWIGSPGGNRAAGHKHVHMVYVHSVFWDPGSLVSKSLQLNNNCGVYPLPLTVSTDDEKETLFQMKSLEALEKIIDTIRRAIGKQKLWYHSKGRVPGLDKEKGHWDCLAGNGTCCQTGNLTSVAGTHMLKRNAWVVYMRVHTRTHACIHSLAIFKEEKVGWTPACMSLCFLAVNAVLPMPNAPASMISSHGCARLYLESTWSYR